MPPVVYRVNRLLMLAGKPMIQHVYERAVATGVADIIIATDDERIRDVAVGFGAGGGDDLTGS